MHIHGHPEGGARWCKCSPWIWSFGRTLGQNTNILCHNILTFGQNTNICSPWKNLLPPTKIPVDAHAHIMVVKGKNSVRNSVSLYRVIAVYWLFISLTVRCDLSFVRTFQLIHIMFSVHTNARCCCIVHSACTRMYLIRTVQRYLFLTVLRTAIRIWTYT